MNRRFLPCVAVAIFFLAGSAAPGFAELSVDERQRHDLYDRAIDDELPDGNARPTRTGRFGLRLRCRILGVRGFDLGVCGNGALRRLLRVRMRM